MSTRSATVIRQETPVYKKNDEGYYEKDGTKLEEVARFYRHCDGYPEGHGAEMATSFCKTEDWEGGGWFQYLFGPFMTGQNKEGTDFEGWGAPRIEFEPKGWTHGDLEYLYAVTMYLDGRLTITVWSIGWDDDKAYERVMEGEPMFEGTPPEYLEWIAGRV